MKKTFSFNVENKKPERQVDSIKYEIKKYIGRERRKKLPDDADFWAFDCKVGSSSEQAVPTHVADINKAINIVLEDKNPSCYVEIIARPEKRKAMSKE